MEAGEALAPAEPPRSGARLTLHRPVWTYVILVVNALLWLAMELAGGSENLGVLIRFGAKYNLAILQGEYWRFVTPVFLHIGFLHLAVNSYALLIFGRDVERLFGGGRFLAMYLLGGIGGSVASFVGNDALSAGASGAIFGLVGAMVVYLLVYRHHFGQGGQRQLANLLFVVLLNLMLGFLGSGIDNLGHIGGLVVGLALGWAYCPAYRLVPSEDPNLPVRLVDAYSWVRAASVSAAVLAVLAAVTYSGIVRWTVLYSKSLVF